MFWICDQRNVPSLGMFQLLLSSDYTASRSFSHPAPPANGLEVHKKLRGDTARTADPNWSEISHTIWHHDQQSKLVEEGGRGDVQNYGICPPKETLHDEDLLSWRRKAMDTCLLMGNSKWIPYLRFACTWSFCFTSYTVCMSNHKFSHFCPSKSLYLTGKERASGWVGLTYLQHIPSPARHSIGNLRVGFICWHFSCRKKKYDNNNISLALYTTMHF